MPAFIFDLDGTLIDSTYAHVLAWRQALEAGGLHVDDWRIHRRIGMSGSLLLKALSQELSLEISPAQAEWLDRRHGEIFKTFEFAHRPTRGATALLGHLRRAKIPFGIATSGTRPAINPSLKALGIGDDIVVVEGKGIQHPKPEPDELLRCQQQLGARCEDCFVVGDAIWDLLAAGRARMFSLGLLCGGRAASELFDAGAFRVFADPLELHNSLYQLGIGAN